MISWSISSPATRMDRLTTIPPSETTATSVVPPPMSTIMLPVASETGPDRRCQRLLDQMGLTCPGVPRRVVNGHLLDLGDPARDPDHHPRAWDQAELRVDPTDKVLEHLLGDIEVADDAILQGTHRHDICRGTADHALGLGANRQDLLCPLVD